MTLRITCQLRRCFLGIASLIGLFILSCCYFHFQFEKREHIDLSLNQALTPQAGVINLTEVFPDGLWTVNSNNRFGNQMGEYATLYALAKLNGKKAGILPGMVNMLGSIFKLTLPHLTEIQEREIPWRNYWLHDWMSEKFKHIEGKFVKLTGCPNSFTFYHHLRDEICREFTFHDYLKEQANDYLEKLKGTRTNVTYIGVHVRRGDYVIVMPRDRKGVVADKGYLEKATAYFRSKYKEPIFVVASNDMKWCKANIDASKGDVYFSGDGNESSPKRDFALLAHCNHTIMTIGTFGHWVAYLAGGETIYLTNFTLPSSPYLKLFRYEASFLPEWIGIPADLSSVH